MNQAARNIAATVAHKLAALGLFDDAALKPDVMLALAAEVEKELKFSGLKLKVAK